MTIERIHELVAGATAARTRTRDPIQRGQWFTACRPHLSALLAERDETAGVIADLSGRLGAWDDRIPTSPHLPATTRGQEREEWWIRHLHDLETVCDRHAAAMTSLDAIGAMLDPSVSSSAPFRAWMGAS